MTQYTAKAGIPYAELTDAPNIQTYAQGLALAIEPMVTPVYASTVSRDAANPIPTEGDKCYVDSKGLFLFNGVDWRYSSGWSNYTPTWSTSTGLHTPAYGNAVQNGRWNVTNGMCTFSWKVTFGSTTTFGSSATTSDNWTFSLPVNCSNPSTPSAYPIGFGHIQTGASTNAKGHFPICPELPGSGSQVWQADIAGSGDGGFVTNNGYIDALTPETWTIAANSFIAVFGMYEVAVI